MKGKNNPNEKKTIVSPGRHVDPMQRRDNQLMLAFAGTST
jgi:hypothetical protein